MSETSGTVLALTRQARRLRRDRLQSDALTVCKKVLQHPRATDVQRLSALRVAADCIEWPELPAEVDILTGLVEEGGAGPLVQLEAARILLDASSDGVLSDGVFLRGEWNGIRANSRNRDTARAMRLLLRAVEQSPAEGARRSVRRSVILLQAAGIWAAACRGADVMAGLFCPEDPLPEIEIGMGRRPPASLADAPAPFALRSSLAECCSNGEIWHWMLQEAERACASARPTCLSAHADFWDAVIPQAGSYHKPVPREVFDGMPDTAVPLRRGDSFAAVELPDPVNPLRLRLEALRTASPKLKRSLMAILADMAKERYQFARAAEFLQRLIDSGPAKSLLSWAEEQRSRILSPALTLETTPRPPALGPPVIKITYRNVSSVMLSVRRIGLPEAFEGIRSFLRQCTSVPDDCRASFRGLSDALFSPQVERLLRPAAAPWRVDLQHDPGHLDQTHSFPLPVKGAGGWLVEASASGAEPTRLLVWTEDLTVVEQYLGSGQEWLVADAMTGEPAEGAVMKAIGHPRKEQTGMRLEEITCTAGPDGVIEVPSGRLTEHRIWNFLIRDPHGGSAVESFILNSRRGPLETAAARREICVLTDQPVYRPGQTMRWKLWMVRCTLTGGGAADAYAGDEVIVGMHSGGALLEQTVQIDSFGAAHGEWEIPDDAPTGELRFQVSLPGLTPRAGHRMLSYKAGTIRIEEYRKPDFEVVVSVPDKPVRPGESVQVKVQARYFFGAPVAGGQVVLRIRRKVFSSVWYPPFAWAWLYGRATACWIPPHESLPRGFEDVLLSSPWGESLPEVSAVLGEDGLAMLEFAATYNPRQSILGIPCADHYALVAEVTDSSRRVVCGSVEVTVSRTPVQIFVWTHRGHYRRGESVQVSVHVRTPGGATVSGDVRLEVRRAAGGPEDGSSQTRVLHLDQRGQATATVTPGSGRWTIEAVYLPETTDVRACCDISVSGEDRGQMPVIETIELIPDRITYNPGDALRLLVRAPGRHVMLWIRPETAAPQRVHVILTDGEAVVEVPVQESDVPNFHLTAVCVHAGTVHRVTRDIPVPPRRKLLQLEVSAAEPRAEPRTKARLVLRLTDCDGAPVAARGALAVWDKALEAIASPPDTLARNFWRTLRNWHPDSPYYLEKVSVQRPDGRCKFRALRGGPLGTFRWRELEVRPTSFWRGSMERGGSAPAGLARGAGEDAVYQCLDLAPAVQTEEPEPDIRREFADSACWNPDLEFRDDGTAEVEFDLPDNLTTWHIRAWAVGPDAAVGEGDAEIIVSKDLLVRLHAPRFFQERDELILSAVVHSFRAVPQSVAVELSFEEDVLTTAADVPLSVRVELPPRGETRLDWPVRVAHKAAAGRSETAVRVTVRAPAGGDAVELRVPVQIYGRLVTQGESRVLESNEPSAIIAFHVPGERDPERSRLTASVTSSIAAPLVRSLPYLVHFPYHCTEQTLNRFLGAWMIRHTLAALGVDPAGIMLPAADAALSHRRSEPQEFDLSESRLSALAEKNLRRLAKAQLSGGGWPWFRGGKEADVWITALVVRGLRRSQALGCSLPEDMIQRAMTCLRGSLVQFWSEEKACLIIPEPAPLSLMELTWVLFVLSERIPGAAETGSLPGRLRDALLEHVHGERSRLSLQGRLLLALTYLDHSGGERARSLLLEVEQHMLTDEQHQLCSLRLPDSGWWHWSGLPAETHAWWLLLRCRLEPEARTTALAAKYLMTLRETAERWPSTAATALAIEALCTWMQVSGEAAAETSTLLQWDDMPAVEQRLDPASPGGQPEPFVLEGQEITTGDHALAISRQGSGRLYADAWLTVFSQEEHMAAAGSGLSLTHSLWKIVSAADGSPQRVRLPDEPLLPSGSIIEMELTFRVPHSCNYLMLDVPKPAGCEPLEQTSGWIWDPLTAFREIRDNRTVLFLPHLPAGLSTAVVRWRTETPGKWHTMPARLSAIYAPRLAASGPSWTLRVAE